MAWYLVGCAQALLQLHGITHAAAVTEHDSHTVDTHAVVYKAEAGGVGGRVNIGCQQLACGSEERVGESEGEVAPLPVAAKALEAQQRVESAKQEWMIDRHKELNVSQMARALM